MAAAPASESVSLEGVLGHEVADADRADPPVRQQLLQGAVGDRPFTRMEDVIDVGELRGISER